MTMVSTLRRALRDNRGASAAEFALVLPLFALLLFGIIDAGRFLWETNKLKKATQYGARIAAVVDPVEGALNSEKFIGKVVNGATLVQGDVVPASAMGPISCATASGVSNVACAGTAPVLTATTTPNATSFGEIVTRMRLMVGETGSDLDSGYLTADNVVVRYEASGLGYAGNPYGPDVAPLVTVGLQDMEFRPITFLLLVDIDMPAIETTLTAEDMASHNTAWGRQSN